MNRALNDEKRQFLLSIKLGEPQWELMAHAKEFEQSKSVAIGEPENIF